MRHENGLVRQPGSSSGRVRGGLLIGTVTAICCLVARALPSTVCAQDAPATLPADLRPLDIVRPLMRRSALIRAASRQSYTLAS